VVAHGTQRQHAFVEKKRSRSDRAGCSTTSSSARASLVRRMISDAGLLRISSAINGLKAGFQNFVLLRYLKIDFKQR
jgi:hypothetical protein